MVTRTKTDIKAIVPDNIVAVIERTQNILSVLILAYFGLVTSFGVMEIVSALI